MSIDPKNPEEKVHVVKPPHPSRLRLAIVMLIPVYPLITAILYVIMPLTDGWQIWQRTLLIAPLMIFSIIFVIGPNVQKYFGWFIARVPKD
jgi:antibiotic biosynthesis monooxygenase (ABM) superfamily enzyme